MRHSCPAVAHERTVGSDDPVAGDQDRDPVVPVGLAHRTNRIGPTDHFGLLTVGSRLAVGDLAEPAPHGLLEFGARRAHGDVEAASLGVEVLIELRLRARENLVVARHEGCAGVFGEALHLGRQHAPVYELEQVQGVVVGCRDHGTEARRESVDGQAACGRRATG